MQITEREKILALLSAHIEQRPGLEFANYGNVASYRAEQRAIGQDLAHARILLSAVRWRESIDATQLREAFSSSFSGRLSITDGPQPGQLRLDYCTGQYFPTEYRRAACAVLASALWAYTRGCAMPDDAALARIKQTPGDWLREHFRREFGRTIAKRWFQ